MNDLMETIHANKVNCDILTGYDDERQFRYGVRLRPWKQTSVPEMIIATGGTLEDAINKSCDMAARGRWEDLDWAKRPWKQEVPREGGWKR